MRLLLRCCENGSVRGWRAFLLGIVAAFAVFSGAAPATASVTLLLEQPYGRMGVVNPTGHSAIYLDHVCAETPLRLRTCRPGELGAVISRYNDVGGYDWVAMPLLPYLYAVDDPREIPTSADEVSVSRLRNEYRRKNLTAIAPDTTEGYPPAGNWYELIGSAYDRTIYGFEVNSTPEQDERLIALLNDRTNVQRYNGAFRNCADFTRVTLNRFYPHAVRRNLIADLGLSTPKSVARGLTHYAAKHPEADLRIFMVPQVEGTLPRSHHAQGVTESLLKRYGVPLTLLSPVAAGVVFVAYLGHGRFDVPRGATVLDVSKMTPEMAPESVPTSGFTAVGAGGASAAEPPIPGAFPGLLPVGAAPIVPASTAAFPVSINAPLLETPLFR